MAKIELRKSRKEEVEIAVHLIYSSGPPSFEYVFKNSGKNAMDFLHHAFVRQGGEFSFDNHHSLYRDNVMVGIGSFFDGSIAKNFTIYDGLNILRFYKFGSPSVIKNGLRVEQIIKLPKVNQMALAHIAILSDYRGKGLGTELMIQLMNASKAKEDQKYVLDVSEENPRAHALYNRLGFTVTAKMKSDLRNKYSYVANHFRMEREVSII